MLFHNNNTIVIIKPKPYTKVDAPFMVSGTVPLRLLKVGDNFDYRLSLDLLEVTGRIISGRTVDIMRASNEQNENQILNFSFLFGFSEANIGFMIKSQGRMTLCLSVIGHTRNTDWIEAYLPVIVSQFEPSDGADRRIIKQHKTIKRRVRQYRRNSVKYAEELGKIYLRREKIFEENRRIESEPYCDLCDDKFADEIFWMIGDGEDKEIRLLNEKYKETIEWSGPLCRGIVGRFNGFVFKVHSNDHGKHFHVIHKEKEIDARFSFPEINLINYKKSRNIIDKKTVENIKKYFSQPENLRKLEAEFLKRPEMLI